MRCCAFQTLIFYLLAVHNNVEAGRCRETIEMEMTQDVIDFIVELHNQLRHRVASGQEYRGSPGPQPPAFNMADLEWDEELANVASEWAHNCEFQHDPNLRTMQMGQNLAITFNSDQLTTPNWADAAIDQWYSEVENVNCRTVSSLTSLQGANDRNIGHYTQMVWAETTAVGCAAIGYTDDSILVEMPYRILYVCNYSPQGNFIDQPIYDADFSYSDCPEFR